MNLLIPEKIILGGVVPRVVGELILDLFDYFLRCRAFPRSVNVTDVVICELDDKASTLGVVAMLAKVLLGRLGLSKLQTDQNVTGAEKTGLSEVALKC